MKNKITNSLFMLLAGLLLAGCGSHETSISSSVKGELQGSNSLAFNPFDSTPSITASLDNPSISSNIDNSRWMNILGSYVGYDIAGSKIIFTISEDGSAILDGDLEVPMEFTRDPSSNPYSSHLESDGYFIFVSNDDPECILEFWDKYGNGNDYSLELIQDPNNYIDGVGGYYLYNQVELTKQ